MTSEEEKAILEAELPPLRLELNKTFHKLQKAYKLMHTYEQRYQKLRAEYERKDRQLAMVDGRYQVLPPAELMKKKRTTKELIVRLNKQQILHIAAELGVKLEEE